eukprot:TRINITY_DN159_c0_g1_i1.p1 TRINITY_DN159_c0_g1~~TRINITY_DN159_c0_g1_i1.p1  ORF type:complete len:382 (+),score=91.53 TRINITY_DN159_c0_g1_i1:62-1207(+)
MQAGSSSTKTGQTFWVVAVPKKYAKLEDVYKHTMQYLNAKVSVLDHPTNFRNGTMDELYGLSDDLGRMDQFVEVVVSKIVKQIKDLSAESGRDDKKFSLVVGNTNIQTYLNRFEWNDSKYRTQSTLRDIAEGITQEVTQTDEELRDSQAKFTAVSHAIEVAERNKSGSLQVRDLSSVIKANHIIESEHLTTLFVVVSKHNEKDWINSYEHLSEFVVPRSSKEITSDNENSLRSVVLFKTDVDTFKTAASKKKFLVRDFTYNPDVTDEQTEKIKDQKDQRAEIQGDLTRWCKQSFSETFASWIHLKIIRLFVESVLRFGLPREYTFFLLEPDMRKGEKKLRDALQQKFGHLGSEHMLGDTGDVNLAGASEEFYPYVFTSFEL